MMILVGWCYVFNLWVITLPVAQVAQLIIDSANQEPAGTQLDFFSKVTWGVVSSRSASRWVYKGSAGEYLWTFRWVAIIPTFLVWSSFICPWCRVCKCSSQCMWGAKYMAFVHQDACSITTTKIRDKHPGGQFWNQCLVMESAVERCVGTLEPWDFLLPVEGYPSHLECPRCSGTQECTMAVVLLVVEHHAGTTNATWHPCFRSSIWSLWTQQFWGTAGSSSLGGRKPSVRFAWSGFCLVRLMWMSIEFTCIRIYKDYTEDLTLPCWFLQDLGFKAEALCRCWFLAVGKVDLKQWWCVVLCTEDGVLSDIFGLQSSFTLLQMQGVLSSFGSKMPISAETVCEASKGYPLLSQGGVTWSLGFF